MKNHAEILSKLNELTQTAKENDIDTHRNLPLKWELRNGVLYLDDIWIAPADVIDLANIDWYIADATLGCLMIPTTDGTLDIIFYGADQDFGIRHIERTIKQGMRHTK